jgi:cellulose synthase/poly-beta-1,6-N-acetylglucosamine synthase-like glycosyltransferase
MLEAFYTFIQAYFVYITGYTLLFSVAGLFYRSLSAPVQRPQPHRIAILIPVYLENEVILQSIKYIQRQDYPSRFYDVFVLADSLDTNTLCELREQNIHIVEIDFKQRTKAKAISKGLAYAQTIDNYDITVILDADNVMDKHFLSIINQAYASGHRAIQGQRVAKNKNNSIAILDGISEAVNNAIYRKGYQALNLSAPVIGSGMAFDTQLLTSAFQEIDLNSKGEDRELQLEIIGRGQKIYYAEKALVFDEKVDQKQAFRQQRKRWILNQFISLVNSFPSSVKQLLRGNLSYFNIAFLSAIQLPRLINLGLFFIWVLLLWLHDRNIGFATSTFGLYLLSIIIAVPRGYYNKKTLSALAQLPQTFGIMLLSLFNAREANRQFIHTSHSTKHKIDL